MKSSIVDEVSHCGEEFVSKFISYYGRLPTDEEIDEAVAIFNLSLTRRRDICAH